MAQELDDLFSGNLGNTMDFLTEKSTKNNDGLYRIDLNKCLDKKKGYNATIRFLPNLTKEGKVGQSAIEKISHYANIKAVKELSGFFDSPKNFNETCPLSTLYYTMTNSKNAILMEKAKCLQYSKKYFSYVLILEDEQQPELVGKIMIFQYGKIIKEKISQQLSGEISGESINVFDLSNGADFKLIVKELVTGDDTYPDYKNSAFRQSSPISIWNEEKKTFKKVPLLDDRIDPKFQSIIKESLLKRDFELEDFAPKRLTEEQLTKIANITTYLTGKGSTTYTTASSDDFDFEEGPETKTNKKAAVVDDEDDFFADI